MKLSQQAKPFTAMIFSLLFVVPALGGLVLLFVISLSGKTVTARQPSLFIVQPLPGIYQPVDHFRRYTEKHVNCHQFSNNHKKFIYNDSLNAFYRGYHRTLASIELTDDATTNDLLLTTLNGSRFIYNNGKITPVEQQNPAEANTLFQSTRHRRNRVINLPGTLYPLPYDHSFFEAIYGMDRQHVISNCQIVKFGNMARPFNGANLAARQLISCFKEIKKAAYSNIMIAEWIKSVTLYDTLAFRHIANDKRPSLHSYGIALDLRSRYYGPGIYWYWDRTNPKWWKKENAGDDIPTIVIDLFEKHGFIWGGDWYYYDTMHFEYRPELALRVLPDEGYAK